MCEQVLGIDPADEGEKPKPRTSRRRAMCLPAAPQFFKREGHLKVQRKHVETITAGGNGGEARNCVPYR
jgi:hypothetical protein